jgi:hypothetical protein
LIEHCHYFCRYKNAIKSFLSDRRVPACSDRFFVAALPTVAVRGAALEFPLRCAASLFLHEMNSVLTTDLDDPRDVGVARLCELFSAAREEFVDS